MVGLHVEEIRRNPTVRDVRESQCICQDVIDLVHTARVRMHPRPFVPFSLFEKGGGRSHEPCREPLPELGPRLVRPSETPVSDRPKKLSMLSL